MEKREKKIMNEKKKKTERYKKDTKLQYLSVFK